MNIWYMLSIAFGILSFVCFGIYLYNHYVFFNRLCRTILLMATYVFYLGCVGFIIFIMWFILSLPMLLIFGDMDMDVYPDGWVFTSPILGYLIWLIVFYIISFIKECYVCTDDKKKVEKV